jgi:hypothetical protein
MSAKSSKSKEKKEQLLALAKSGVKRPGMTDPLGRSLNNYVSKASHSYDEMFAAEIRGLVPGWFRAAKTTEAVN